MSLRNFVRAALLGALFVAGGSRPASAQTIGTFTWQMQPYCNVITVTVTQVGGSYRLEGFDNQCGGNRASAIGTATFNNGDQVGLGFNIVTSPGGVPVQVDALINISTGFNGTWRDSAGRTGTFVFGANSGGSPRPAAGIGVGAIDSTQIQRRVSGTCPANTTLVSVNQDGSLTCAVPGAVGLPQQQSTAVGNLALQGLANGLLNTAIGTSALQGTNSGSNNTAVGALALDAASGSSATNNTAVGANALGDVTTGGNNTAIGARAGLALTTGTDNVYIGYDVAAGAAAESNTIRIGGGTTAATYIGGILGYSGTTQQVGIDAQGRLGVVAPSSRAFKQDIVPLGDVQAKVQALRPVSFFYKPEYDGGAHALQYGLIAEEVATIAPELVVRNPQGDPNGVKYQFLPTLLLAEVQRLEQERKAQGDEIKALREELEALKALLRTTAARQ